MDRWIEEGREGRMSGWQEGERKGMRWIDGW